MIAQYQLANKKKTPFFRLVPISTVTDVSQVMKMVMTNIVAGVAREEHSSSALLVLVLFVRFVL